MTNELWERRRRTFEQTAEAYDRFRPTYPDEVFADIKKYADLAPDDRILEIGAGTGRATAKFAPWGNPLLAIEPASAMAEIARSNVARFDNVEVRTTTFEDAGLPPNSFGLVTCAQVFHWLDEATRLDRIAASLYAHGSVAIIDNVIVTPAADREFHVRVQEVYREFAAELAHRGDFRKPHEVPEHPLVSSPLFYDLEVREHPWSWTLPTDRYIGLLHTHSPHAALEPDARERLTDGIARLIDAEFGGHVTESYVAMVSLARRS
ncbi:MAG: class I SAM-dependent methyltransferase [Actinomycetota bacterium]